MGFSNLVECPQQIPKWSFWHFHRAEVDPASPGFLRQTFAIRFRRFHRGSSGRAEAVWKLPAVVDFCRSAAVRHGGFHRKYRAWP